MNRQALNLKEEAAKLESQLESSCNDLKMSEGELVPSTRPSISVVDPLEPSQVEVLSLLLFVECHLLGRFLEIVKKDNAKAAAVYKSNCQDDQNGNSCFNLAQLYQTEMVDHHEAYNYNRKGCDLGNAKCCFGAALANFSDDLDKGCVGKNPSLAIDNLKRSCQLGSGMACQLLSQLFLIGFPGFVDKDLSACLKYHFEANGQLNFLEDRTELEAILNSLIAMRTPSSGVQ